VDTPPLELRQTTVDLTGVMRVLGENLYSRPEVVLRELVQNAHDSLTRRRLEASSDGPDAPALIRVRGLSDPPTLEVEDTGAGLTADEIVRYLATVGAGYTRQLRASSQDDALIGAFGLGFLSAFIAARSVEVETCSWQTPNETWVYRSHDGQRYTLAPGAPRAVGTRVRLLLRPEHVDLADEARLEAIVLHYAGLLPQPIYLGAAETPVNAEPPPWRQPDLPPVRARKLRMALAERFEGVFKPLCTFEIGGPPEGEPNSGTDARGMLWIQDGLTYGSSDNRNLHVFLRGMLLDDDHRELLPRWAGFVGGLLESSRLTPTASREDLQRDAVYAATRARLLDALLDGLAALAREEPETWRRVLTRHNEALLGAAIAEPRLFDLLAEELTVPTTEGDLRVAPLVRRGNGTVHVSLAEHGGFEETLFRALKLPIAVGTRYGVLPFLRAWAEARGARLVELGTAAGNRAVFREAKPDPQTHAKLERAFGRPRYKLVPARFQPPEVPLVLVPDREVELKRRAESDDAARRISESALSLVRLYTKTIDDRLDGHLYVNLEAPTVAAVLAADLDTPGARQGLALLRGLVSLTSGAGQADAGDDFLVALRAVGEAATTLLGTT
jgi:molecular chaperone HtpG